MKLFLYAGNIFCILVTFLCIVNTFCILKHFCIHTIFCKWETLFHTGNFLYTGNMYLENFMCSRNLLLYTRKTFFCVFIYFFILGLHGVVFHGSKRDTAPGDGGHRVLQARNPQCPTEKN